MAEKENFTLNILGIDYGLEYVEEIDRSETGVSGICHQAKQKIIIGKGTDKRRAYTLLHELLHAADFETGDEDSYLTESQNKRLAIALWAIFEANPALVSLLFLQEETSG